jgi:hypothetical protein
MASYGLILGGSSCAGKTTAAREIGVRLERDVIETDHSVPDDPCLHPLRGSDSVWDRPPSEICQLLISAAEAAVPYQVTQSLQLAEGQADWILEGERVHPSLIERLTTLGVARGVFIVEPDAERLTETLVGQLPGFMILAQPRRRTIAEVDRLYNMWLLDETSLRNGMSVESEPWATLADRVLCMIRSSRTSPKESLNGRAHT